MKQFLLGLAGILIGVAALKHTKFLHEMVGSIRWAESFFGMGGTITVLKLFSVGLIVISALYLLGWF